MRVLVTGGRGQLGTELSQLLDSAGVSYRAVDLPEIDITNSKAMEATVDDGSRFSAVIHAAAYTNVDKAESDKDNVFRINAEATGSIARICAARSIPILYISTDFVFSGDKGGAYEVDDEPAPLSVYGASKLAGEVAVRSADGPSFIVRTAWVFGPHGQNFPRSILRAAASGQPLRVVDDQVGSPTYARDLAELLLALLGIGTKPEGIERVKPLTEPAPYGTYHATNRGACSWFEFAQEVLRQAGRDISVEPINSAQLSRPAARPAYSVLSMQKINDLGLITRPWQDTLVPFLQRLRPLAPELFSGANLEDISR